MADRYSYEEIRSAAVDILAGREAVSYEPSQFKHLETGVAEVLAKRHPQEEASHRTFGRSSDLQHGDADTFREVFWDLFRQGIITLGLDSANDKYPFFKLGSHGKRILENSDTYFYHDVTSYETRLREVAPTIDDLTLLYAKEAMQAYRAGCMLSATIAIGVAAESAFDRFLQSAAGNQRDGSRFAAAAKEKLALPRVKKAKNALDAMGKELPSPLREDLDTTFAGILALIRNHRNESGHPTGIIISREQCYILLQLFISYFRKTEQLRQHFA